MFHLLLLKPEGAVDSCLSKNPLQVVALANGH